MVKRINNQSGFTLFEILVAVIIFAFFSLSYTSINNNNVTQSIMTSRKIILSQLCKNKFNEMLIYPPKYTQSLILSPKTGDFTDEGYPGYTYKVEYKKFVLPDISKIMGKKKDEQQNNNSDTNSNSDGFQQIILEAMKDNMEKIMWQIKVTVIQKEGQYEQSLSAWIRDPNQKISFQF